MPLTMEQEFTNIECEMRRLPLLRLYSKVYGDGKLQASKARRILKRMPFFRSLHPFRYLSMRGHRIFQGQTSVTDGQAHVRSFEAFAVVSLKGFKSRHLDGYEWAYEFFKDDISRETVRDCMKLHLLGKTLRRNTTCECYFEDGIISLGNDEIFIDGGAFSGYSVETFIKRLVPDEENAGKYAYSN